MEVHAVVSWAAHGTRMPARCTHAPRVHVDRGRDVPATRPNWILSVKKKLKWDHQWLRHVSGTGRPVRPIDHRVGVRTTVSRPLTLIFWTEPAAAVPVESITSRATGGEGRRPRGASKLRGASRCVGHGRDPCAGHRRTGACRACNYSLQLLSTSGKSRAASSWMDADKLASRWEMDVYNRALENTNSKRSLTSLTLILHKFKSWVSHVKDRYCYR